MRCASLVGVALVAALTAAPALAFQCTPGQTNAFVSIHWNTRQLRIASRAGASATLPADALDRIVRQAFETWARPTCSDIEFMFEPVVADEPRYDDLLCDRVRDDKARFNEAVGLAQVSQVVLVHACWPHDPAALALTTMTFAPDDGVIRFGVIEVNERLPPSPDGFVFQEVDDVAVCRQSGDVYDLGAVLTHEVGHFIGLAHTDVRGSTPGDQPTMTATVDPCDVEFRSLSGDDVDGLCFVYPARLGERQCLPLPDQVEPYVTSTAFGCGVTGPDGALGITLAAMMLAALARTCSAARSRR